MNSTERKLRKQSERHAISTDDDLRSSPEDSVISEPFLAKEQLDKRRKNGNGKVRLQAMKTTQQGNQGSPQKRSSNRRQSRPSATDTSVRSKVNSELHKKPPLSPRTKKSASDLKEERRRLVKSEPRRRKRNSRESDRKKKHDRKRAPRLDLDNSTIVDADDFGAEYLTVSMKPVRMTSRSGKLKSPLGNINFQRSRKVPFQKGQTSSDARHGKKNRNAALVQINTEEMERELDGIHGSVHNNDDDESSNIANGAKSPELWVGERRKQAQLDRRGLATAIPKSNRKEFSSPANKPKSTTHSSSAEKRQLRLATPENDNASRRSSHNAGASSQNRHEDHSHEKRRPQTMALRLRSSATPSNLSNRQNQPRASTSMAGSSNSINDMPGEPLGALRGISVHPNRSSTPSFRKIDRRRRRKKESQFTEDHNEAVKKIQRWMRRRQQLLEPSLWGMQGRDDTRRRGTKIDIEDSIDDAEHMEKRQSSSVTSGTGAARGKLKVTAK